MRRCFLCDNTEYRLIKTIDGLNIYECTACGLAFTEKSKSSWKNLYKKDGVYSTDDYAPRIDQQKRKFGHVADVLRRFLVSGAVLDVGAGHGLFSSVASERGYDVSSVEPNLSLMYADRKKVKIFKKSFQSFITETKKRYDAICFLDVLEHFEHPDSVVKKTKFIIKKDGRLVILLPNYKSLIASVCNNWSWWMVEDHTYHFSPKSLRNLLTNEGFTIEYTETFEYLTDFKKNLDGNYENIRPGLIRKICKLVTMYPFLGFYVLFRQAVWKLGRGGLLFVIAHYEKKPQT